MKNRYLKSSMFVALAVVGLTSCKKDKSEEIPSYDVPTTYNFSDASYATSTSRVRMWLEQNTYAGTGNSGAAALTAAKANDFWNNTNNPFTDAALNTSGVNIAGKITDGPTYKAYFDGLVATSQSLGATAATNGTAGFVNRTATGKIAVDAKGVEYSQAIAKGLMGSLLFKQAVDLLIAVKTDATVALQKQHFDEAFGYLAVPVNYNPNTTYANTLPVAERPLAWGGYLAERGKDIKAGEVIFNAFLKGRAAIGAKDVKVRDAQIQIILEKWEQLAAAAALAYVTSPTTGDVGLGTFPGAKLHALSEGWGFIASFKYRPATSKLTAANFTKLNDIINTNFYTLLNEPGYPKLVEAQGILKATYGL
ncbi:DUF4856 domain-containing protein [Pedobacter nyackensis]|uniref:DUF4856 domain-containing protein n=1 Tax=Pedobacter nyackensis TaxID=475255 RepID=UPI00292EA6BF|nr:DUF4856 domain-containing protein [Pedobacter nyackensis]